jgi:hypothetical protein
MPRSRLLLALLLAPPLLIAAGLGLRHLLRPPVSPWRPLFRGIHYYAEDLHSPRGASGRVVAVRIQLDAPGLDLLHRPLDPGAVSRGGHYTLAWPDLELARYDYDILINTAIYYPGRLWESYPGQTVRALDMVVTQGRATHFWEHSYLLWIDRARTPRLNFYKPPKPEDIAAAAWGIGVQGVQIFEGKARPAAIGGHDRAEARAFIGFHAARRELFLLAFEHVTPPEMIDTAIRLGVEYGGMMDSGNSTWLLFSSRARGLPPLTGIRGGRPLGPYLAIRAAPLP